MATSNTISRLAEKVVDDLYTEYPSLFVTLSRAAYINSLQQALNDIVQTDIDLGTTTPDYESVSLRLIQALSGIPGWYDLITPATSAALTFPTSSAVAYRKLPRHSRATRSRPLAAFPIRAAADPTPNIR